MYTNEYLPKNCFNILVNIPLNKNKLFERKHFHVDSFELFTDMRNKNNYLDEINHFKLEKRKLYNNIKIWKFQAKNMNE